MFPMNDPSDNTYPEHGYLWGQGLQAPHAATLGQDQERGDGRESKKCSAPTSSRTWVQELQPVLGLAELMGTEEAEWGAVSPSTGMLQIPP